MHALTPLLKFELANRNFLHLPPTKIPGVNVPTSHLGYYFVALIVSGVFHELGHALAATR